MHILRMRGSTSYTFNFAHDGSSLQIQLADKALSYLGDSKDFIAALILWAATITNHPVRQLTITSRTGSSLVSIEVYALPDDSIDEMLFVLLYEQGRWDYCSPSQPESEELRRLADSLKDSLSPHLKSAGGSELLTQFQQMHPSTAGYC